MRSVTYSMSASLDGYIVGPDGSFNWTEPDLRDLKPMEQAEKAGRLLAERAKAAGIEAAVFDRGGYQYHGRVKALAEGAREGGLAF